MPYPGFKPGTFGVVAGSPNPYTAWSSGAERKGHIFHVEGILNYLKRAHHAHKGLSGHILQTSFQNFTYNQLNYRQIKVILGICSSNGNPNLSIGQN